MPLATRVRNLGSQAIPTRPAGHERVIAEMNQNSIGSIWGQAKSHIVTDKENWRIDRQNPTSDNAANIQVQKNGGSGKSTAACAIVPNKYNIGKPAPTDTAATFAYNARLSELAKIVRSALTQSASTWVPVNTDYGHISTYEVYGEFSA